MADTNETKTGLDSVEKDDSMDLMSLIKGNEKEETADAVVEEKKEKELSPLEKAQLAKENGKGLVVDNNEMKDESDPSQLKNKAMDDADMESKAYMDDMDEKIKVANNIVVIKKPKNKMEMASMMDQIEILQKGGTLPLEGAFVREKTAEEMNAEEFGTAPAAANESADAEDPNVADVEEEEEEISEEKRKLVEVMIDKTGLGADIFFSDEEKEKLQHATEIRLKEIEEVDISTIKIRQANKPFLESVKEYQMASSMVPVVFPASRFKAQMIGLSYGEIGDITFNTENVSYEQVRKRLTIIYNKMVNPSIKFDSFEDFLTKFAYVDIDIAMYGLIVATFPEIDEITMQCRNPQCGASFSHSFAPRNLIRWDRMDEKFMTVLKEIVDNPEKGDELVSESPTRVSKRIRLPYSGFLLDIGITSSYDYLNEIINNSVGDKFEKEHPDDVNGILQLGNIFLSLIQKVYVPGEDGYYTEYSEYEDKIQALYYIKPEEIQIISSILNKYNSSYSPVFELRDIKCPNCGMVTKRVNADLNAMVFQKFQRQMSSSLNIENISVL